MGRWNLSFLPTPYWAKFVVCRGYMLHHASLIMRVHHFLSTKREGGGMSVEGESNAVGRNNKNGTFNNHWQGLKLQTWWDAGGVGVDWMKAELQHIFSSVVFRRTAQSEGKERERSGDLPS